MDTASSCNLCWNVATVIGVLYFLRLLLNEGWSMLSGFHAYFLAPSGILRTDLKKYGKWAVVTGASEGIGRGYALELARQGLNVVIMSLSQEDLQLVAAEIRDKYQREVRIIFVDFLVGQEIYPQIAEKLKDLEIGVLVNNVGMANEYPAYLHEIHEKRLRNIVELNCQTMVQMTKMLLAKMIDRKCGAIINISSFSGCFPVPLYNVYSATKVFVIYFSDALRKEYCSKGIHVQTVIPSRVSTRSSGFSRTSFLVPSAVDYARAAVATIGIQRTTLGFFPHALMGYIMMSLPTIVRNRLIQNELMTNRIEYLRKKSK